MTLAELPYSTNDLFSPGDFAFHMRFRRGDIAQFYQNTSDHTDIIAERRKWLQHDSAKYVAGLPQAEPLLAEAVEVANSVGVTSRIGNSASATMTNLGAAWEPDLLILQSPSPTSQPILLAGCVCFPSSWALEEKIGRPLDAIHAPVPTLNDQFANPVQQFLARIKPGVSWERINWGLSRSPELNQHPSRNLPRLDSAVTLEQVWFRAEYQSLIALAKTGGVLFGIRLVIEPLTKLRSDQNFIAGLTRAIQSMPEPIAVYKGVAGARARLLELLAFSRPL
jgi:dimethylamine monooxygenase subunit A